MELFFRPRDIKYIGKGTLPFGTFDKTEEWLPITRYLEKGAELFPSKTLFKIGDGEGSIIGDYSYGEANSWANRVANGLIEEYGVKKGDLVGIYMLNRAEFVISILAIHKTGGVQVPINKDEKGERLAYIINYSEQQVLFTDEESLRFIKEIAHQLGNLRYIFVTGDIASETIPSSNGKIKVFPFSSFDRFSDKNPGVDVKVADVERCMFTSGTTGMPKGVSRNHGGVILTVRAYIQNQGVRSEDVLMTVLSLAHANAQVMCLFAAIGAGASCVIYPRFSASNFWKWAAECGATLTNMLGSVSEYLWATPTSEWDKKHNIRLAMAGPAPKNRKEFEERFNTRVVEGYGSTEMGMVLWQYPEDHRPGSSGFVAEGYYVELRDPDNTDVVIRKFWDPYSGEELSDDMKGIMFIKPLIENTTLNEYFKDKKRTEEAFDSEGFFNSDDLFVKGIDERYYFQGRYSRIRVSGENVDPNAVSNFALKYKGIKSAVAVGVRLPNISDDEIKLNIVLEEGADFDPVDFCKWMAERVPVYMVPRFIEVYKEFPLTSTQKVNMGKLKELSAKTWDRNEAGLKFRSRK